MDDPAEELRHWQPVIDLARKLAHVEDDPEDIVTDLCIAVYRAEDWRGPSQHGTITAAAPEAIHE